MVRGRGLKSRKFKNAVRRIVNSEIETKHHRVTADDLSFSTDGQVIELNSIDSQGVGSGQFIGQEVRQWYLKVRGQVQQADSTNVVRVVCFRPTCAALEEMRENALTLAEFFYESTPSLSLYAPWRESMVDSVYYDKTMILNQTTQQNDKIQMFNIRQKLNGLKLKYIEGSAGGNVSQVSPIILLGFLSDSGVSAHPTAVFHSTLYYKDA